MSKMLYDPYFKKKKRTMKNNILLVSQLENNILLMSQSLVNFFRAASWQGNFCKNDPN